MRTVRIREKVKRYLMDHEGSETGKIYDHINETSRWGVTMQQLGNILSKDKDIKQVGTVRKQGALSGRYDMMVWALKSHYVEKASINKEELKQVILDWLEQSGPGEYLARDIRKGLGFSHTIAHTNIFKQAADEGPEWVTAVKTYKPSRGSFYTYVVSPIN
jgi:hypothetical protein